MSKNRVWIYCRVAHEDNFALEMQKEGLLHSLGSDDEVVGITLETGSGINMNRPGLNEVRQMAADGRMDTLLALSMSRIGRNIGDTLSWLRDVADSGVKINLQKENITLGKADLSNPIAAICGRAAIEAQYENAENNTNQMLM